MAVVDRTAEAIPHSSGFHITLPFPVLARLEYRPASGYNFKIVFFIQASRKIIRKKAKNSDGSSWHPNHEIESVSATEAENGLARFARDYRPVVFRNLVPDWPILAAGRRGVAAAADYLRRYDNASRAKLMRGAPDIAGRFFYDEQVRGYNFAVDERTLSDVMDELCRLVEEADPPSLYAGSTPTDEALPGFSADNPLPLPTPGARARIWVGNASHISAHYDLSDNIAVVAMGRRRFTLFPPEQTPNLYVGPLDITIAGQPVSMVDMRAPDFDRFPRFRQAADSAVTALLEPGDAIFIPTLWWHQVIAFDPVNLLVNYWYNAPPQGSPFAALLHAMQTVRDLPEGQRTAWRIWFDHFVFDTAARDAAEHLPEHARGVAGAPSGRRASAIRDYVVRAFMQR